jgi:putative transposase
MQERTHDGKVFRILDTVDEHTQECLLVKVARNFTLYDVLDCLPDLLYERGVPVHLHSDNSSEFIARRLRAWLNRLTVKSLFIEPGNPWKNGYSESFNGKMRDELLDGEIFYSLKEADILIEQWRIEHRTVRLHSALGYHSPASLAVIELTPQFQPLGLALRVV